MKTKDTLHPTDNNVTKLEQFKNLLESTSPSLMGQLNPWFHNKTNSKKTPSLWLNHKQWQKGKKHKLKMRQSLNNQPTFPNKFQSSAITVRTLSRCLPTV